MEKEDEVIIMCDIQEMTKRFVVEYHLLWLDPTHQSRTYQKEVEEMRRIYDFKISTEDWEDVKDQIQNEKTTYHLILSVVQDDIILKEIEDISNIALIFIFSNNFPASLNSSNYTKIKCVEGNIESLLLKIDEYLVEWQRKDSSVRTDFPAFAPVFDDYDKSKMNYLHYYLQGFTKFQNRAQAKRDFIRLAKQIDTTRSFLNHFEKSYNKYNVESILNWYTKPCFVYKMTNNCLRIATSDSIQYCRFVLKDLEAAIKEQFHNGSKNFHGLLYRGAYMSSQDWEKIKNNVGRDIEMHGFLSTSKEEAVAFDFLKANPDQKAFVTIVVPRCSEKEEQGFVDIKEFSYFKNEEEILFNVRSRFTILDIGKRYFQGHQCRHLILLYGKQAWKIETHSNKKVYQIEIDFEASQKCSLCEKDIQYYQDKIFTSLGSPIEYICEACLNKNCTPLLYLDSKKKEILSIQKKLLISIEGEILVQSKRIPFYGYKCIKCQKRRISAPFYFKCLSCPNDHNLWCKKCQGCQQESHNIIIERSGFSFWSEKLSPQENDLLNYKLNEATKNNDLQFHQGEIFFKGQEYLKARLYYEKVIEQQQDNQKIHRAYHGLGLVNKELGELKQAVSFYDQAISIHPNPDSQTAKSYHQLGVAYKMLGDFTLSKEYYEKGLQIRETIYQSHHQEIAESYDGLAWVYETLGDFEKAIFYYQKGLEMFRQVYGENHPLTAKSYNNLATVYTTRGDNKTAIEYYEKALEIDKLVLGDFHPDTAFVYSSLGIEYSKGIDHNKSIEVLTKSIEILKAIYGDRNQHIIVPSNNLATIYTDLGRFSEALEVYKKNLEIGISIYGENNPGLGIYYENLGSAYVRLQDFDKGTEHLFKCLTILKEAYQTEVHNEIASCYCRIAELYKKSNNNELSLEYDSKALEIYKYIFGENDFHVGACYHNIANNSMDRCDYPKAIEYYLKSIEISKQMFCSHNIDLAKTYCSLALVYEITGNYSNCIEYNELALAIFDAFYGVDHIDTATCYNQMGACFRRDGYPEQAIEHHERALRIYQKSFTETENYEEIALSYDLIGSSYREMEEFDLALEYHEKCLEIRRKIEKIAPEKIGESLVNIGKVYQDLEEFAKATEYYVEVIERPGEEDGNTYHAYEGLAGMNYREENYEASREYYEKGLNVCLKYYGESHEQTAAFYFNWATAELKCENYENTEELLFKSLKAKKEVYGENDLRLKSNYLGLSIVYKYLDNEEKAIEFSQMAEDLEAPQAGV